MLHATLWDRKGYGCPKKITGYYRSQLRWATLAVSVPTVAKLLAACSSARIPVVVNGDAGALRRSAELVEVAHNVQSYVDKRHMRCQLLRRRGGSNSDRPFSARVACARQGRRLYGRGSAPIHPSGGGYGVSRQGYGRGNGANQKGIAFPASIAQSGHRDFGQTSRKQPRLADKVAAQLSFRALMRPVSAPVINKHIF